MGCGGSKPEPGEETGTGLKPILRKIDEIRRRRNHGGPVRKDSIVSTTELLFPEEEEEEEPGGTDEETSRRSDVNGGGFSPENNKAHPPTPTPSVDQVESVKSEKVEKAAAEPTKVAGSDGASAGGVEKMGGEEEKKNNGEEEGGDEVGEKKEEKGEEAEKGEEEEEEEGEKLTGGGRVVAVRGGRLGYEEEELPGSPSFRVYFVGSVRDSSDDDSVNAGSRKSGMSEKEDDGATVRKDNIDSSYSEGLECKSLKKYKGRRFKALTKGSSVVYGLLNVRSCYNNNSHTNNSSSHDNPTLLSEKAAT